MNLYVVKVDYTEEDSSYIIRARSPLEAADLYFKAYLQSKITFWEHELFENVPHLHVCSQLTEPDEGQTGILAYGTAEETYIDLDRLPSYTKAAAQGYIKGDDPELSTYDLD